MEASSAKQSPLYQKHIPIFTRSVKGKFRNFKTAVMVLAYSIYFLLPWMPWERVSAADQAILFDLGSRRFFIFNLIVYPQELRAERANQEIELTAREAAILDLLHEHAGCPVARDTFLDRCWGLDYFPDSRTLDQHIAMLRKKIELDPANAEIIETVRGVGYRYRVS